MHLRGGGKSTKRTQSKVTKLLRALGKCPTAGGAGARAPQIVEGTELSWSQQVSTFVGIKYRVVQEASF